MSTVLVTGAAGAIASALLPILDRSDWTVTTTDRIGMARPGHTVADLEDAEACARLATDRPDAVVHLAGAAGGDPAVLFPANVVGTVHVLGQLRAGTRVLVAGSAAEYGAGTGEPISEATPLRPVSPYGWSKVAQTSAAASVAAHRDLRLTVVRPFNVFGPHVPDGSALGNMRRQLRTSSNGETVSVTTGRLDVVRDYVSAGFVAEAISQVLDDSDPPPVVNVCSGTGIALGDVLSAMATELSLRIAVDTDPDLAALPAPDAVVGDPTLLTERYGTVETPTASDIARAVLGPN